jgi:hypothetical protein
MNRTLLVGKTIILVISLSACAKSGIVSQPAVTAPSPISSPTFEPVVPSPSTVPTASPKPSASVKPAIDESKYIPGIESTDIKLSLKDFLKMRFSGGTETTDFGKAVDPDTSAEMTCSISGILPLHVHSVSFAVVGVDEAGVESTAKYYLAYVASLPYDGADPTAAKEWVEATLKSTSKSGGSKWKTIGGVKFELAGTDFARTLTISKSTK